jgi:hypothetical protein
MLNQGITASIPTASLAAGLNPVVSQGKRGEQWVAELLGKYGTLNENGCVFIGSTAVAGTTIPVNAATLVSTFTLFNPAASGKNLHLISYDLGIDGTTAVVIGSVFLFHQINGAALATLTSLTPVNGKIGGGLASVANLYSAATYTGTPVLLKPILSFGATSALGGPDVAHVDFDGTIIVPPGVSITVAGNVAQTQPMAQSFVWAELPV